MRYVPVVLIGLAGLAGPAWGSDLEDCTKGGGDSKKVIAACTKVIDDKSVGRDELVTVLIKRGWEIYRDGAKNRAMADFDKAIENDPSSARALEERAKANSTRGQRERERAILDCDKAIALEPARASAFALRAGIYRQLGKWEQAFADFEKAVSLDPKNADRYRARADAHAAKLNWKQAAADYDVAVTLDARPHRYLSRGLAFLRLGETDRANADFDKAIELSQDRAEAFRLRGIFFAGKDNSRAAADFNQAIGLAPDRATLYKYRGEFHYYWGSDINAALADYEKAISLASTATDRALLHERRGDAYRRKNEMDLALAEYTKAISLDGDAWEDRALIYQQRKQFELALNDYSKGIEVRPNDAHGYIARGRFFQNYDDLERATADFDKAISLDDAASTFYAYRADVYLAKGRSDEAIAEYSKQIEMNPTSASAYHDRGLAHRQIGDIGRASADFNKAIELSPPKTTTYYISRGKLLLDQRELDAASADFNKVIEINPKSRYGLFWRGRVYQERGLYEQAIAELDQAIALKKDYIAAYTHRGQVLEEKGDTDQAMAEYQKAISFVPDSKDEEEKTAKLDAQRRLTVLKAQALRPMEKDAGVRVALLIANSKYDAQERLKNPAADAAALAEKLQKLGFIKVKVLHDLPLAAMKKAVLEFADAAEAADWALVFYSGHGMQVESENYLIPVDARLARSDRVEDEAIPLSWLQKKIKGARKLRVIILDACRENPFLPKMERRPGTLTRALTRGLAPVSAQSGEVVAFSALPDALAQDGAGKNSPYAEALLKHIDKKIGIEHYFRFVREEVMARTNGQQEPQAVNTRLGSEEYRFRVR